MRHAALALLLVLAVPARAQGGALDASFGSGGLVTTDLGNGLDFIVQLAEQPDGALLAVGTSNEAGLERPALVRYTSGGQLDPTFGTDGVVIRDLGGVRGQFTSVAVLAGGEILVAGYARFAPNNEAVFLARYDAAGQLDPTFGTGGIVETPYTGRFTRIVELADGRLLLAGPLGQFSPPQSARASVVRMTAAGALDATFGTGGRFMLTTLSGAAVPMALDGQGRIVFASGLGSSAPGGGAILVGRLTADGQPDAAFGTDGLVQVDVQVGGSEVREGANALAVDSQDRVVLAGRVLSAAPPITVNDALLVRLTAAGALDGTFGTGGYTTVDRADGADGLGGVALTDDGTIYAAGTTDEPVTGNDDLLVMRFAADGAHDATFGVGGYVVTDVAGGTDEGQTMMRDAAGRLVVGGYASSNAFAVARYLPNVGVATEGGPEAQALALAVAPNPARGAAAGALTLDTAQEVTVEVYDALGRRVAVLHAGPLAAGAHTLPLDAAALPAGVYVVRATAGGAAVSARLTLVR